MNTQVFAGPQVWTLLYIHDLTATNLSNQGDYSINPM
jgi:hypothetical protein